MPLKPSTPAEKVVRISSLGQRMKWEIVDRAISGIIPFIAFALITVFIPFGRQIWTSEIRFFAALTVLNGLFRIYYLLPVKRQGFVTNSQFRLINISVLVNSTLWGLTLALTTLDMAESGNFSIYAVATLLGFTTGGLFSLGASKLLFRYYLFWMMGVQVLILLVSDFYLHYPLDRGLYITFIIITGYFLREGNMFRARLQRAHVEQIRSEIRNRLLVRSRQELMDQSSRNIHSSRLASLGEMAGGVAHEINNPLAIIDLNLEALRMQMDEEGVVPVEEAKKMLQRSQNSVERITKIVRGLRNFSRSGESDPLEVISLLKVIEDALDFCREKVKAQRVTLEIEGDTSVLILCRPVEISQVLVNLVNNAYDVVCDPALTERSIRFAVDASETHARVRVTDSGRPLSPAVKEKFFQPFFTTKPVGAGTGLGLSISRAIAKNHGGDLTLDLENPRTTLVLHIPLAKA